jgi:hypothetical protein
MNHAALMLGTSSSGSFPVGGGLLFHFDATVPTYMYIDAGTTLVSANGQRIHRWKSKNSTHFMDQSTLSYKPLYTTTGGQNGKSFLYFDGLNDVMSMVWSTAFQTNARSFFLIAQPLGTQGTTSYPFFFGMGNGTNGTQYYFSHGSAYYEFSQGSWTVDSVRSNTYVQDSFRMHIGRSHSPFAPSGIKLRVTNTSGVSTDNSDTPPSGTVSYGSPSRVAFGARPSGASAHDFHGSFRVYEWGVYNRGISDTETNLLTSYFRTKYNV